MKTIDTVRTVVDRYHAGIADRDTAVQQITVIIEQAGIEAARVLFDLADDDLKRIRRLNDRLIAAKQT